MLATKAADAALKACAAQGHNVSVAIVARDGSIKVLLKADNSGAHPIKGAQGKAFTSAATGRDKAGHSKFIASKSANAGRCCHIVPARLGSRTTSAMPGSWKFSASSARARAL
ncbi:heme-binding protein [Labrys neptuniae]